MDKIFTLNDEIQITKNKSVLVKDLILIKGEILKLIKKGYLFDDEVLKAAHIIKTTKMKFNYEFVDNKPKMKDLPKDTENIKTILKSLQSIENMKDDIIPNDFKKILLNKVEDEEYDEEEDE